LSSQRIREFDSSARVIIVFLIFVTLFSIPSGAQVAGGTLSGTIADPSEKLVPQAQVSITNVATGITTTVTTNSDGFYIAPQPAPRRIPSHGLRKGLQHGDQKRDLAHRRFAASL